VTARPRIPQGTISPKGSSSRPTLKAKPWDVTQRAMRTPMAPIFASPTQAPGHPGHSAGGHAVVEARPDQDLLEVPHVAVDVATVRSQVQDRVADDLAGPVVGHVATAARLEDLESAFA
jgi:hypothetical protein